MTLLRDLRHAARGLLRSPGFAVAAALALALGIGANTAIFSVVNAVLIEPLPFRDPGRLVVLWGQSQAEGAQQEQASAPDLQDWREQARSFEGLAAWLSWGLSLTGEGEPVELTTVRASANLFPLLGVEPVLGRRFTPDEDEAGRDRVVILSDAFWRDRFGGDPAAVGRTITLDAEPHTIVGVMPPGFRFPDDDDVDIWTPLAYRPFETRSRARRMFYVLGRLAPGVPLDQAQLEMSGIAARLGAAYPATNRGWEVTVEPEREVVIGSAREPLLILLGAVGFVLLIACTNVANLFLARGAGREREIAVRVALGASRGRIVRYLLSESLLVALLGGAAGLMLAMWGIDLIVALDPGHLPAWNQIDIDATVLGYTALVALLTATLSGLVPALHASKTDLHESLKETSGRASGGIVRRRLRHALIVSEVSLSVVLLVGASLLIHSFYRLLRQDTGFDPTNLGTMTLYLADNRYGEDTREIAFFEELLQRLRAVPGVASAAGVTTLPMSPVGVDHDMPFALPGTPSGLADPRPQADFRIATENYFQTMRIPLIRGREFTETDRAGAPRVAIINQTLADRFLAGEDPIGRSMVWASGNSTVEIVGVVGNVRHRGLDAEPRPEYYFPFRQMSYGSLEMVVRTSGDPLAIMNALRQEVYAIDPLLSITRTSTMAELMSDSVGERRFNLLLIGSFAALALLLAAIGIYGVISYSVAQRTREIGIRIALGARAPDVIRGVLAEGLRLAAAGVIIGVSASLFLGRLIAGLLYGVTPLDPLTFAAVPIVLLAVAAIASGLPARRAARLSPVTALGQGE